MTNISSLDVRRSKSQPILMLLGRLVEYILECLYSKEEGLLLKFGDIGKNVHSNMCAKFKNLDKSVLWTSWSSTPWTTRVF